jgi:hypothetical protein
MTASSAYADVTVERSRDFKDRSPQLRRAWNFCVALPGECSQAFWPVPNRRGFHAAPVGVILT